MPMMRTPSCCSKLKSSSDEELVECKEKIAEENVQSVTFDLQPIPHTVVALDFSWI